MPLPPVCKASCQAAEAHGAASLRVTSPQRRKQLHSPSIKLSASLTRQLSAKPSLPNKYSSFRHMPDTDAVGTARLPQVDTASALVVAAADADVHYACSRQVRLKLNAC
jgi:hypothetical protein